MRHRKVAQRSRAATTGPGAKGLRRSGPHTQDHSTSAPAQRRPNPSESSPTRRHREPIATEAEILVGTVMWLCRVRAWMAEQLDLAAADEGLPSDVITLRRADLEAFRGGLAQAVSLLDSLSVDTAQLPPPAEPSPAPEITATTARGTVH